MKLALKMSVEDCNNIMFDLGHARDCDDKILKGLRENLGDYFEILYKQSKESFQIYYMLRTINFLNIRRNLKKGCWALNLIK